MPKTTPSKQAQQPLTGPIFTTAPVEVPTDQSAPQPIWIRLPKSGKLCPWTGLSRSALNALILGKNPPVKSVSLKKRYAIRGTRLIHLGSLLGHIESVAAAQQSTEPSTSEDGSTNS